MKDFIKTYSPAKSLKMIFVYDHVFTMYDALPKASIYLVTDDANRFTIIKDFTN